MFIGVFTKSPYINSSELRAQTRLEGKVPKSEITRVQREKLDLEIQGICRSDHACV